MGFSEYCHAVFRNTFNNQNSQLLLLQTITKGSPGGWKPLILAAKLSPQRSDPIYKRKANPVVLTHETGVILNLTTYTIRHSDNLLILQETTEVEDSP